MGQATLPFAPPRDIPPRPSGQSPDVEYDVRKTTPWHDVLQRKGQRARVGTGAVGCIQCAAASVPAAAHTIHPAKTKTVRGGSGMAPTTRAVRLPPGRVTAQISPRHCGCQAYSEAPSPGCSRRYLARTLRLCSSAKGRQVRSRMTWTASSMGWMMAGMRASPKQVVAMTRP